MDVHHRHQSPKKKKKKKQGKSRHVNIRGSRQEGQKTEAGKEPEKLVEDRGVGYFKKKERKKS